MSEITTEDVMPVLSAGRHRNAHRGACFMEYASYLAGLRWSDRPACTHPSLAALARLVNDLSSDKARSALAVYIPSVVGLNGDAPQLPIVVSVLAATHALPVANQNRQRALATALVRCEQLIAGWDVPGISRTRANIRAAFVDAPGTEEWARNFIATSGMETQPLRLNEEAILRTAVIGIADACVTDRDVRLKRLLSAAIAECESVLLPAAGVQDEHRVPVSA
jgi:hypothetical protein